MNTAKEIRSDIFEMLVKVNDIHILENIRSELEVIYKKSEELELLPNFMEGVKGIREDVSIEQLIAEQNYKPHTYKEFREVADAIDWDDIPLEKLLESLTK